MRHLLGVLGCCWACSVPHDAKRSEPRASVSAVPSVASSAPRSDPGPIRMEQLEARAPDEPPVFVMRGGPRGAGHLVFLHGMCGHGLGYAQAFQFAAAKIGTLIAPQGDVSCGDVWSKWSGDLAALDARIAAAFRALGDTRELDDVWVLGMSQGATRAVALVRKYPHRYTHLVSMDAPTALKSGDWKQLRAAVMMAGERDRQDLMRQSERALRASGVPTQYLVIPEATHGAMGPTPEKTMETALQFLQQHAADSPRP